MTEIIYLAYGSNLHPLRLRQRVPSCELLGPVSLCGYKLVFHKVGMDGSGKCDLLATGSPDDVAWGVLFRMAAGDKPALDAAEGPGYRCATLPVLFAGQKMDAMTYLSRPDRRNAGLQPYHWYRDLVLLGARLHRFPPAYIAAIARVPGRRDPDPERDALHHRLLADIRNGDSGRR